VRARLRTARKYQETYARQLAVLRDMHTELEQRHRAVLDQLEVFLDHSRPNPCTKVRLVDKDEAVTFAAWLAEETGRDPAEFDVYRCPLCPRRPVTGTRYWPVTNVDQHFRKTRGRHPQLVKAIRARERKVRADGRMLDQRVTPEVIAKLRAKVQESG
jgi:hypothetical protein